MFVFSKAKREVAAMTAKLTGEEMAQAKGAGGGMATYSLFCMDMHYVDDQGNPSTTEVCWYETTDWID